MKGTNINRIIALIIDLICVGILVMAFQNLFPGLFESTDIDILGWNFQVKLNLTLILYLPYFLVFDLFNNGVSIGKQLFGLRIVPKNGTYMTFQQRFLRTLVKLISIMFLPFSAMIYLLFKGYNLQDSMLNTSVVMIKE